MSSLLRYAIRGPQAPFFAVLGILMVLACGKSTPARTPRQSASAVETVHVGYGRHEWMDASRGGEGRPVWADIWYPATQQLEEQTIRYSLSQGKAVPEGAVASDSIEGWVLLSHGAGGSPDNYAWLAEALARGGFVVVGLHHYGESRVYGEDSLDRLAMFRPWERVRDVLFARDAILRSAKWKALLRDQPLFGIGHSSGGHTLLAASGVPYDPSRMSEYCRSAPEGAVGRDCGYASKMSARDWQEAGQPPEEKPASFDAWTGLVLFEPAMGPSFRSEDLSQFSRPVHIYASRPGDFLAFDAHAKHVADALPSGSLSVLDQGEGHFVFIEDCQLDIQVLGLPLCKDRNGVDRASVHQRLARETRKLLESWTQK